MQSLFKSSASKLIKLVPVLCRNQSSFSRTGPREDFGFRREEGGFRRNRDDSGRHITEARQILSQHNVEDLDQSKLGFLLYTAYKERDLDIALRVFPAMRRPKGIDYHQYVNILRQFTTSSQKEVVQRELFKIWDSIVASGYEDDVRLLTSLLKALEFSPEEQRKLITSVISKAAHPTYDGTLLTSFFKFCSVHEEHELAEKVAQWGESILMKEHGSESYFLSAIKSAKLRGATVPELLALWEKVKEHRLNESCFLITAMCSVLESDIEAQKRFIESILEKPASPTFDARVLRHFEQHCVWNLDKDLATRIWEWAGDIRSREYGTEIYFSACLSFFRATSAPLAEFQSLWNEITDYSLNEKRVLVKEMCYALSIDRDEQKQFINMILEKPTNLTFDCGVLSLFLEHCCETNDSELAQRIWKWGEDVRMRSSEESQDYFSSHLRYLTITGAPLEEIKSLWDQVTKRRLQERKSLKDAYLSALEAHGVTE